jgi:hypothetical protein
MKYKTKRPSREELAPLCDQMTTAQIAAQYGVTNSCVWRWLKDDGLQPVKRTRKDVYSARGRMWSVLGFMFNNRTVSDAEIGRLNDCTREYVGQIRAAAIAHGIL